jgi:hypothetical protein
VEIVYSANTADGERTTVVVEGIQAKYPGSKARITPMERDEWLSMDGRRRDNEDRSSGHPLPTEGVR